MSRMNLWRKGMKKARFLGWKRADFGSLDTTLFEPRVMHQPGAIPLFMEHRVA